ncbi:MAG: HAMP domain-containing histidine kinase, partial [Firmicutes bacterium]|nr:HAMP domain-containing histidine kinase [Bacillota bacterium]
MPLVIFTGTVMNSVENYFNEERKAEVLRQANTMSIQILRGGFVNGSFVEENIERYIADSGLAGDARVMIIDSTGTAVTDTSNTDIGKTFLIPEVVDALANKAVAKIQPSGSLYVAVPIYVTETEAILGSVLIIASTADIKNTVDDIGGNIQMILIGIVIAVGIIIFFLSKIFIKPIKDMAQNVKRMAQGHLDSRVPVSEGGMRSELTDLSYSFNNMAEKLEQLEITRQNFVSNVSHELKTPLSSMKVLSESVLLQEDLPKEVYVEFLQDINSEIDRMSNIISDLLNLVRLDQQEIPVNFAQTDIGALLESVVKRLKPLAAEKGLELSMEISREVWAEADEMKLSLALSNLVENAIKYTEEGSVKVNLDSDHQNLFIKVADTGIGIPEEDLNRIFDRFYR